MVVLKMAKSKKKTKSKAKGRFWPGQTVWVAIRGLYEEDEVVAVSEGKVWVDVAEGPFDAVTGEDLRDQTYAMASMKLLSEKPEGYKEEE